MNLANIVVFLLSREIKKTCILHFIYHLHANGQIRISSCLLICLASTVIIVSVEDDAFLLCVDGS